MVIMDETNDPVNEEIINNKGIGIGYRDILCS
jgi:hypothetical protein